jgi:hypothetical protein
MSNREIDALVAEKDCRHDAWEVANGRCQCGKCGGLPSNKIWGQLHPGYPEFHHDQYEAPIRHKAPRGLCPSWLSSLLGDDRTFQALAREGRMTYRTVGRLRGRGGACAARVYTYTSSRSSRCSQVEALRVIPNFCIFMFEMQSPDSSSTSVRK